MITDRAGGGDICAGWRKIAINFIDAYVLRCNFYTGGSRKNSAYGAESNTETKKVAINIFAILNIPNTAIN